MKKQNFFGVVLFVFLAVIMIELMVYAHEGEVHKESEDSDTTIDHFTTPNNHAIPKSADGDNDNKLSYQEVINYYTELAQTKSQSAADLAKADEITLSVLQSSSDKSAIFTGAKACTGDVCPLDTHISSEPSPPSAATAPDWDNLEKGQKDNWEKLNNGDNEDATKELYLAAKGNLENARSFYNILDSSEAADIATGNMAYITSHLIQRSNGNLETAKKIWGYAVAKETAEPDFSQHWNDYIDAVSPSISPDGKITLTAKNERLDEVISAPSGYIIIGKGNTYNTGTGSRLTGSPDFKEGDVVAIMKNTQDGLYYIAREEPDGDGVPKLVLTNIRYLTATRDVFKEKIADLPEGKRSAVRYADTSESAVAQPPAAESSPSPYLLDNKPLTKVGEGNIYTDGTNQYEITESGGTITAFQLGKPAGATISYIKNSGIRGTGTYTLSETLSVASKNPDTVKGANFYRRTEGDTAQYIAEKAGNYYYLASDGKWKPFNTKPTVKEISAEKKLVAPERVTKIVREGQKEESHSLKL